jgi:hypothetical protein
MNLSPRVMKHLLTASVAVVGVLAHWAVFAPVHIMGWVVATGATWLYFDEAERHQELLLKYMRSIEQQYDIFRYYHEEGEFKNLEQESQEDVSE